ncbi:hypothetical protein ACFPRL_12575 [Pseudoclavibacter helvolus]
MRRPGSANPSRRPSRVDATAISTARPRSWITHPRPRPFVRSIR